MSADKLIQKLIEMKNPTIAGLDPLAEYLPASMIKSDNLHDKAQAILAFNKALIDVLCDIVGAVKPQSAYYELLGWEGIRVLHETIIYAQNKGMYVVVDGKRNDIGSTAEAYAKAYFETFGADGLTVNGYLGTDGIKPFISAEKMIFALVKTSNKSSGDLQDLKLENGITVYEQMGQLVNNWGSEFIGKCGYSNVGAVIGATYPEQLAEMREKLPNTFFLVPGYGAQGAGAKDIKGAFTKGLGAVINSSRAIMCAYKQQNLPAEKFAEAARIEAVRMRDEINSVI